MATTNFVDGVTGLFAPWHNDVDQAVYRSKDYAIDTGIVNAYIVALNPVKTAYTSGMAVVFSTANANTGPATINVNGLGIIPITAQGNVPLTSGQILSNSPMVGIINSSGGNHLEILASNNAAWNGLRYAALAGLSTQAFNVAKATTATQAVPFGQVLGLGQTWQDVLASRGPGVTYTNSTGKPIVVAITAYQTNGIDGSGTLVVGGVSVGYHRNFVNASQPAVTQISAIVPDGGNYTYFVGGTNTVMLWAELK
jgi:hypothetical protein